MRNVNIHEAKTHFSKLVDTAMHGEEIIIAKAGKPAARLVPLREAVRKIQFGLMQGEVEIAENFDAPLPEDVLAGFEGAK
ncbi:MAG: type II toxin-antitoxin system Phd/YefM family antitoxin [Deltaproteobacteria bacterium]|jgi:prevent-host-death family protein|uniref:type II toxin-antitoxin system Phd/YefM family antitoxin n=1 Tax=Hydrosulfovibrio ferrireducens TaxID=2934181 RepID=UPI00121475DE|nr:MAG: type II toxin-antitoxin system Phd/YefM family antitoxin [Deltaproteobacteria bacterium]